MAQFVPRPWMQPADAADTTCFPPPPTPTRDLSIAKDEKAQCQREPDDVAGTKSTM